MQAAKCTNHYDNKNLIQLCNNNKKNVYQRGLNHRFCKLGSNSRARAIHLKGKDKPSLTFLYNNNNNYKWISLHAKKIKSLHSQSHETSTTTSYQGHFR